MAALVARKGKIVYHKAFGMADNEAGWALPLHHHPGNSYINDLFALDDGVTLSPDELTLRVENILKQVMQETDQRIEDLQMLKTNEVLDAAAVIIVLKNSNVPAEQFNYLTQPKLLE